MSTGPEALLALARGDGLLRIDRERLVRRIDGLCRRAAKGQPVDKALAALMAEHEQAFRRSENFRAALPKLGYPEDLPVSRERPLILEAMRAHRVIIVCGDTGSGKTTQLPKMAFEAGGAEFGRIGVTQPRRLAAVGMARRVAEECGGEVGDVVGLHVRFEQKVSERTRIKFMTDGILLAELAHDPDWSQYDTLILDEAHERSLNIDFILGCLRRLLERRADLKVIISSATLDAERFADFFNGAPVIRVEGRLYPIVDQFRPNDEDRDLSGEILEALLDLDRQHGERDTLVFLPGEREIRDAAKKIDGHYRQRADVLPLFSRLSMGDQQRIFSSSNRRRVVLATNVAETSLTIPGIRAVIDSGWVRVHRYDARAGVQRLVTERVSQASSRQRRGRCGRTGPGVCVRLYSEEDLAESPAYADPEIRRSSLAEVILRMAVLGLPPVADFPFLDPPKPGHIAEGYRALHEIGAMTGERRLTPRGRVLATFALEPRLARMLEEGHEERVLPAVLVVAAFLSIQDPRERPSERAEAADRAHEAWRHPDSDFLAILNAWNAVMASGESRGKRRTFCRDHFLNPRRVEEWINLVDDLRSTCGEHRWEVPASIGGLDVRDTDGLHRSLLAGIPRRVGCRDDGKLFRDPQGQSFMVFPGSALADKPPRWVFAATLMETSRLFARECAKLDPAWLEQVAPHLCRSVYEAPAWNAERGFVECTERVVLGNLTLVHGRKVHYGRVAPVEARAIFLRDGLRPCDLGSTHASLKAYRRLLGSLQDWDRKLRRPGYLAESDLLLEHLDRVVPAEVCGTADFDTWLKQSQARWVPRIGELLQGEVLVEEDYPDSLDVAGVPIAVRYAHAPDDPATDGVTLEISSERLAGVPEEILEWTIPAWLPEKVGLLVRSLDKPLRLACNPIADTTRDFLAWADAQGFRYTHSLRGCLAAFLAARLGRILGAPDFDPGKLPPQLKTHLRVLGEGGKEIFRGDVFPGRGELSVNRAPAKARQAGVWHEEGLRAWPGTDIPERVEHQGRPQWPALVDEGKTAGLRLFPHADDARVAHQDGVIRLFRLRCPDLVTHLEKRLPLPSAVQLDLAAMRGGDALGDLQRGILAEALGLSENLPRDEAAFVRAAETARGCLFEVAARWGEALREVFALRSRVRSDVEKVPPGPARHDLDLQQSTLWAPGWLRDPENLRRYPRYQQGILNRIQRLLQDPAKDARKQAEIEEALNLVGEHAASLPPGCLRELFRKVEELRLNAFAPELKPFEKISVKRIAAWIAER
jgi:ATP-dependent helicase HrpA